MSVAAVLGVTEPVVDLFAHWTHREAIGVAAGHPHLAAERDDRLAGHCGLHDLLLADVVGEPLVIPRLPEILVGPGLLALQHGG